MADLPFGFTLRVPESWYEFDVWRAGRTADLARLVDARVAATPELAPHRPVLLKVLREVAELAARHGAVFGAAMTDHVEDAGTVLATLMVLHTRGRSDPGGNTVEAIASGVVAVPRTPGTPAWRSVEIVELDAGRAVRVRGIETGELDTVVMQTLVPVPGGHGVLDVVLTSPHLSLAEPMLDLFDAISATLAWSDPQGE
ncbi:unnamed protein product [[Actinomadura] parvosata subsp. kistnae]|uniref:Uncharacterized protein n=1 Tax=[Actinomadura] parvosata subsp. kistnae TaxID=1909395 RepID=A0A1V0AA66_9ACTN|nr:hypothetical protein [Nonomuraea sp. ATCC 55076]AQZ67091.1 hypothetical protein BKM31_41605 [Nonomuraea sp. ATCC 55076]SPL94717.1 unnamed protein product [Actinomadura parvosata subsp. kistnae]